MLAIAGCAVAAGCSTAPGDAAATTSSGRLRVAASINAWGSILAQLGGAKVDATSIITNPDTDPHDYEPTPADGRTVAGASLFVENGIGYDSWAARSLAASPLAGRVVVDVGTLVHVPAGGNPHRWYSPSDVTSVANAITAGLGKLDPADRAYFRARNRAFEQQGLATYHQLIAQIRHRFGGTPIGASESIVSPLADALGLHVLTPASFLQDISEGTDPSPRDLSLINRQIAQRQIRVYVYNSQNATPDVAAQVRAARAQGIPVATVTETLSPANATFQQWQVRQLRQLTAALATGTGR